MLVYPTYTMLLSISTAGIPVAISRLVSENVALEAAAQRQGDPPHRAAHPRGRGPYADADDDRAFGCSGAPAEHPEIYIGFIALAPSILIVSIMSAFRGYLQGHRRMTPTAVSQIIEQAGKLVVSLPLTYLGARRRRLVHAAAGTLVGISISEAAGAVLRLLPDVSPRAG